MASNAKSVIRKVLQLTDELREKEEQIVQFQEEVFVSNPDLANKLFPILKTRLLAFDTPAFTCSGNDESGYSATGYYCVITETETKQYVVSGLNP